MPDLEASMKYRMFASMHPRPWCWFCGRGRHESPAGWYGPWLIERAHIVSSPRREDVRAVILLCSLCHRTQHGQVIVTAEPIETQLLTLPEMLWLKRVSDQPNYDREFLEANHNGRLPYAKMPSRKMQKQYHARRGKPWNSRE